MVYHRQVRAVVGQLLDWTLDVMWRARKGGKSECMQVPIAKKVWRVSLD